MAVTIKDIAKALDISPATVSLALHHSTRIKKSTRIKVETMAKQLSYSPCPQAVGLQAKRSDLVGYLLTNIDESFFNLIAKGINRTATRNGYGLIIAIAETPQEQKEQLEFLFRKRVDGLIISGAHDNTLPDVLAEAEKRDIAVVSTIAEFAQELPVSSVCINNYKGGYVAAEHLLKCGHRNILWASCQRELALRYYGALQAAQCYPNASVRKAIGEVEIRRIMSEPNPPTAILAYSDYDAIKIRHELLELGLLVPKDVSLVGFDGIDTLAMNEFQLTTVVQPQERIGEVAFELLLKNLKTKLVQHIELEPELVIKNSTAEIDASGYSYSV